MSEIMLKNVELKVEETKSSTETTRDPPVAPIVSSSRASNPPVAPIVSSSRASNPPVAPIVKSSTASNPPVAPIVSSSTASNPPVAPIVKSSTASNRPVAPIVSSSTASINETTPTTPHRGCREVEIASQPRRFALSELIIATKNFRREYLLGVGGFGPVYKGWINETGSSPVKPGSGLPVAVKTLNRHGLQGHREWMAEVHFLRNLRHENLVKLVGYCMEGQQRLIVYELMARGSLEHHLFRRSILPWSIRMKITLGAAKGLVYLHEEIQKPVIFRDFKASNILLDVDYNAKLSDFGLARHGPEGDKTHVSTRVMGTNGYAAPEYLMTGHLTVKSDVYSFGVVLLEILSGRKAIDKSRRVGERCLVSWAKPYLRDRHHFWRIIDPRLGGHFSKKGALKATEIASLCLRSNPKHRPQMSQVMEMLMRLPSTSEIGGADVDTNSNNVEARVVAKDKHVAGSLYSPTGSNASSANYTLTNKQKGKLPVYT